jgi:hypothetical protein
MRILYGLLSLLLTCATAGAADKPIQAVAAAPANPQPGSVVTITGIGLDKAMVDQVFLTDQKFDMQVKVLEQTATTLKIRIPPFAKPGRQEVMFQDTANPPRLLEQPVWIEITAQEAAKAKPDAAKNDKLARNTDRR